VIEASNSPSRAVPILMYHGVSRHSSRRFREFVTQPERFEEQMVYLAANGFRVCGISELVEARADPNAQAERILGLTFDDAFKELAVHAVPVLDRLGFGATIYVPTAFIGGTSLWLEKARESERPVLGARELREISAAGIECGAHSHTHPALDVLTEEAARVEIEQSKRVLEETIEREVHSFAYPFGYESAAVRALVAGAGFESACRVNYGLSAADEDVFGISRLPVAEGCSIEDFAALVDGRASLRTRRALAYAWRPIRRGVARPRRRGSAT
jgi:peptidoglycan/xylan/chitin deacetylase (PgdA/CDA1 family)